MKYILNFVKLILMIIATVCIFTLLCSKIASSTFLNKIYFLSKLEETSYYKDIYKIINSNFENYIEQSGLDKEVFNNIISENKVKEDTIVIVKNIYDKKNQTIDVGEIKNNLYNNINAKLGRSLSETEKKSIDEYINKISEEYTKTILYKSQYETKLANIIEKVNKILPVVNIVLIVVIIIILLLILVISYKDIFDGISKIGTTIVATGILFIFIKYYINIKIKIQNIVFLNEPISKIIKEIFADVLNIMFKNGVILLICGIIIIMLSNISKIKKDKHVNFD